ncbi:hypothetical protein [Halalkalicoccus jeotgali]|uniref:Uncharacterized protein n=1 Tax=Halalkalicoccus jeotgali (strain DSM 18796 / CECT 7217 / JCM 14584 / KCTC 4019 / B3) TaxID=795797 RepID=D8J2Q7_HALJB|nr:hypothetical protein [Halalkalicoccus jeotgali]ADJ15014.1 hypothetical protein HacjB3_08155 [Halalkalicoccus jeotgali B3]ELY34970.1 hypothetical protein C497_14567 [Halalkalicoccus jeotgali B3]
MTRIHIVTADPGLAARCGAALAGFEWRHAAEWPRATDIGPTDVILFDPDGLGRPAHAVDSRRTIAIGDRLEPTVRGVERTVASSRFEAAIDARFDALTTGSDDPPTIEVPEALDASAFGELYGAIGSDRDGLR